MGRPISELKSHNSSKAVLSVVLRLAKTAGGQYHNGYMYCPYGQGSMYRDAKLQNGVY